MGTGHLSAHDLHNSASRDLLEHRAERNEKRLSYLYAEVMQS